MGWKRLRGDDGGVSELVGFILMFAVSALVLLTATNVFMQAREDTDHVVGSVELKSIANRFSSRIVQVGSVAQDLPNATYEAEVRVRPHVNGESYHVELTEDHVITRLENGDLEARVTTYNLGALGNVIAEGVAWGESGAMTVAYESWVPATSTDGPLFHDQQKKVTVKTPG